MLFSLRSSHCLSPPREAGWFKPCWCCWGHPCDPLSPLLIYSGVAGTLSTVTPSLALAWSSQKSHLFGGAQNMGSNDGTMPLFPVWWNKSEGKRVQKKKRQKQHREEFKSSKVGMSQNVSLTRLFPKKIQSKKTNPSGMLHSFSYRLLLILILNYILWHL